MSKQTYVVEIHPSALKELAAVPKKQQRQLDRRIRALAQEPRPPTARPMSEKRFKGLWKLRSGEYRIIYQIIARRLIVLIVRIGNRRDVYKRR